MPTASANSSTVAVALVCSDWRLHKPEVDLNTRIAREIGVGRVDVIALPGPDGLIGAARATEWTVALAQTKLLIGAHKAVALAVLGHQQCAGHPVSDSQHVADTTETARRLKAEVGFPGPVHAISLVHHSDTDWRIEKIAEF